MTDHMNPLEKTYYSFFPISSSSGMAKSSCNIVCVRLDLDADVDSDQDD